MKIILSSDVVGLGEEGDIREVAPGYARNFLFRKQFAVPHNADNLNRLEQRRNVIENRKEEKRRKALSVKEQLESEELVFKMMAGKGGRIFGSVNNAAIAQELEHRGYQIDRKKVEVSGHSLKIVGSHVVRVKLYENEEASVRVQIVPTEE